MSGIKRRHFLQFSGATLATLGLSQLQADRYGQMLAQSTPRKRALLVGINRYNDRKWISLEGAENDVQLQKELLVHRFGFAEGDIKLLLGQDATYENILERFQTFLIDWAQPGDVVVFHFSGHGSSVADPENALGTGRVSTIVPVDSQLPNSYPNTGGEVNDITGHTLWLLMRSLKTENVTFVLDSCHSGGARKGVLTVRSRPGDEEILKSGVRLFASQTERDFQKKMMEALGIKDATELGMLRKAGVPQGIMLSAAQEDQSAIDAPFGDTSAGIFTYVLTRYLWQQTGQEPMNQVMVGTIATTQRILRDVFPTAEVVQQPISNVRSGSNRDRQPVYFMSSRSTPAEAVITKVSGDKVDLFLGGIDPKSLEAFGKGATFTLPNGQGQVRVESRDQFRAKGMLVQTGNRGGVQTGAFLQERSRAIPSDLTLRIGLDSSLGQELEAARQALKAINKRIEPVSMQQQDLHYLLGRVTQEYVQQLQKLNIKKLPAVGSMALFSPAADLIPGSDGSASERVTDAVNRLKPKLKSLLAARLVKLTLNPTSSKVSVAAAMAVVDEGVIQAEAFTVRGATVAPVSRSRGQATRSANAQQVKVGTVVQFLIQNNELRDLYSAVLLINVDGGLSVLSPLPGNEDAPPIPAGQRIQVPDQNRGELYRFRVAGDPGVAEVLVIVSTSPMKRAIALLRNLAAEPDRRRGNPVDLDKEPDVAITSLLADLDDGTRGTNAPPVSGANQIDTQQMAALSITFEIQTI
jgi:Caspase domain/Domain of unknown function (DUF4384)